MGGEGSRAIELNWFLFFFFFNFLEKRRKNFYTYPFAPVEGKLGARGSGDKGRGQGKGARGK